LILFFLNYNFFPVHPLLTVMSVLAKGCGWLHSVACGNWRCILKPFLKRSNQLTWP